MDKKGKEKKATTTNNTEYSILMNETNNKNKIKPKNITKPDNLFRLA